MRLSALLVACMSATLAMPAFADDEIAADSDSESADGGASSDIILVTARRRAEDEQSVPAALNVVDYEQLTRTYTVNTSQLSQLVPALNYSSPNPRNTAFTIRGLGSSVVSISQANDGLEPGVGLYVDQVYHARPATAAFDFTDIEQIEVLRGPQGTLFGKNSTAGAIHITSKLPTFDFTRQGEISVGGNGFLQAKAAVSGPVIGDVLAVRLSGSITRRDGVITNIVTGREQNDVHNDAVRGQILFKPSDTFQARVIADFSNFKNECCTQVYVRVAPTLRPLAQRYAALAAGQNYTPASFNPYDRVTDIDADLGVDTNEGGVSAIVDADLGPATLTSVSAWRFWNWDAANDRDYIGLPIQITQHIPSRQDQYSQEFRIASDGDNKINYVGGLYYFYQKITGHPISIYGPLATYWLLGPTFPANLLDGYQTDGDTEFRSASYAVFGEINWKIVPDVTLTGGLRYTYEKKDGSYDVRAFGGGAATTTALANAKASILRSQSYTGHDKDGNLSGRANIAWQINDQILAYTSYARGEKSGGINMSGLPVAADGSPLLSTVVVRPEKVTTWESGFKTSFFDRHLTFNIDAYYTKVRDFQANIVDSAERAPLRSFLANIPKVTVKGVEIDAIARVSSRLNLRFSGSYTDGIYASYPKGPCPIELIGSGTAQCDLSGRPLSGLPKWTGSAGGEYDLPVTVGSVEGKAYVRADGVIRSKQFGDASDSQYTMIKGYALVNASAGFRWKDWELSIFARNLFDKNYLQNVTVQAGNSGLIVGTPSDPRQVGITLRLRTN